MNDIGETVKLKVNFFFQHLLNYNQELSDFDSFLSKLKKETLLYDLL